MATYSTGGSSGDAVAKVESHNQYQSDGIDGNTLSPSPIAQFKKWFDEAISSPDVPEPEAMTLCTTSVPSSTSDHVGFRTDATSSAPRPSARVVLLKQVDPRGFLFYSNYDSRKGREIAANPWVSATFYWRSQHRSVRVCGRAERVETQESQAYFDSRPLGSRIGARASPQSQPIESRQQLEDAVRKEENKWSVPGASGIDPSKEYKGKDVKVQVPDYWGGYRIVPDEVEFWCGRNNRLHDRFRYTRPNLEEAADKDKWTITRLAP